MTDVDERVPCAQEMRSCAASLVARVTARGRLPLDYSERSLRVVDFLIDGLRKGGADPERAHDTLLGLGAYVGEVLVRRAGARWVDFDDRQRAWSGQPVGVRMADGRVWNPLGKVRNRFETGSPEESLLLFYLKLHGRTRRAAA
ncbi:hypothetical protein [Streptomyces sp. H51]|uniref:hypothetical protein n=1 Tax=Streptomyces sp. H51 TaxID=3111770 RepID=UPI002D77B80A|nr:hypothetical protein [Streptomyces sp. H51]